MGRCDGGNISCPPNVGNIEGPNVVDALKTNFFKTNNVFLSISVASCPVCHQFGGTSPFGYFSCSTFDKPDIGKLKMHLMASWKMKKVNIVLIVIVLIVFGYFLNLKYLIFENLVAFRFNSGDIKLILLDDSIKKNRITIIQEKSGMLNGNNILIKDGVLINRYLSKYGWSCFLFMYHNDSICEVCYFKKNIRNLNNHRFETGFNNNKLDMTLHIEGVDSASKMYYKFFVRDSFVYYLDKNKKLYCIDSLKNTSR